MIHTPRSVKLAPCLAAFAFLAISCSGKDERHSLYLNLVPVGDDPFEAVVRLQAMLDDGLQTHVIEPFDLQGAFEPLKAGTCRIELWGLEASGSPSDPLSWGFSPPIQLRDAAQKTSMYFTNTQTAVAHAGPSLVDPQEGLGPAGLPRSLHTDGMLATLAYNQHYLYIEIEVEDEEVVPNHPDWDTGDLVVLAIDGLKDSQAPHPGFDDYLLVFGARQVAELWNPQGSQFPIIKDFREQPGGYTVFVGIPISPLTGNQGPAPRKSIGLGIEIRDADTQDPEAPRRWPADWIPESSGEPLRYVLDGSGADGSGSLSLMTRGFDARQVQRGSVGFSEGIDEFLDSGAVSLSRTRSSAQDDVQIYALWDNAGLYLAGSSDDQLLCTQQRAEGDRPGILRDDAVEVTLQVFLPDKQERLYRVVFNLTGSAAYQDLHGGGPWTPRELYFRFDLDGPLPDDDCQEGSGYTFKLSIPWSDLGYPDSGGMPPGPDDVFGFDLTVYDNDRGAHTVTSFSPMGSGANPDALGALRLFVY